LPINRALVCRAPGPRQHGQGERRESTTGVRLDGDEMAADADDGDAVDASSSYMRQRSARWCHAAAQPLPS
jgi:hypothetical protein